MFSAIYRGCAQLKVILLFMAVLTVAVMPPAFAQDGDLSSLVKDMPKIEALADSEQKDWTQVEDSMAGVSYRVTLPPAWERDNALDVSKDQLSSLLMTEIAHFRGAPHLDGVSTLSIQAMLTKPDYSLSDWFFDFKRDQNFTLVGLQMLSENEITFFYVDIDEAVSKIYRGKAVQLDQMLVLTLHTMAQSVWGDEQGAQAAIIDQVVITPQVSAVAVSEADERQSLKSFVSFIVPEGFRVSNQGLNGIDFHYLTLKSVLKKNGDAPINLFYLEGRDEARLADAIFKIRDLLTGKGYAIAEAPFDYVDNLTFDVGVRRGVIEVSRMMGLDENKKPQEHWLALIEGREGYALVSAQAPPRQGQFLEWGKRTRTIKQLAESIAFLKAE